LDKFELGLAVGKLYDFIWDIFCDWYIELAKIRLNGDDENAKETVKAVLIYVMSNTLKLLHPFMPFITEEIFLTLPHEGETIMTSPWCEYDKSLTFETEEAEMEIIMTAIKAVRNRRSEMNVAPSKKAKVFIETSLVDVFSKGGVFFKRLASASDVEIREKFDDMDTAVSIITESARIYIPMDELIDFKAEIERLEKEKVAVQKDLDFVSSKLSNENFVKKAPAAVVEGQRQSQAQYTEKIKMLTESIENLKSK
ncbi:MAG: class I tRNA ligase family protein, partial [Oscillospiraceae bacterium]